MFENAKWIWLNSEVQPDEYADFITTFEGGAKEYRLCIAAETDYNVFLNGRLAAFGQYAAYPSRTVYEFDAAMCCACHIETVFFFATVKSDITC